MYDPNVEPEGTPVQSADLRHLKNEGSTADGPKLATHAFRKLWDGGYTRLVPIVPPDAELSPYSSLAKRPGGRGKAVGVLGKHGWHGFDWHHIAATEADLDPWAEMGAGVGCIMGQGLVAIDIDALVQALSLQAMNAAFEILGPAPRRIGRAPKMLLLYRCSVDIPYQRVEFKGLDGKTERVEVLGPGQQAVFIGTHPATMKPYLWPDGLPARDELPEISPEQMQAFFDRLVEIMPEASRPTAANAQDRKIVDQDSLVGDLEAIQKAVAAIPNDRSDRQWFLRMGYAIKAALRDHPDEAFDLFWEWCERWTVRDKDYDSAWSFWTSLRPPFSVGAAYLYGEAAKRTGVNMMPEGKFFEVIAGSDAEKSADASPDPIDIFGDDDPAELSTPPAGSLPPVIEAFVRTVAVEMGVPESFVAVPAVAALGGAIGNALTLYPREHSETWAVPASFPVVVVAPPGRKKSPTIAAVLKPHRAIDRELRTTGARERSAWEARYRTSKGKVAADAPPMPLQRQILVDDATLEKQIRIHADNPRGIIRAPDELAAWLGSMGAYKRNGDGDRGTMLRLINGAPVSLERVSGSIFANSALMGLIATTQPEKMRMLARDLGADGMLQRFVFVVDDGVDRTPLDAPTDRAAIADYEQAVRGMFAIPAGGAPVRLSPKAREILVGTWAQVNALRRLPGASSAWESHISKWEGLIYQIALTFHAVETWMTFEEVPTGKGFEVTASTAQRVSRFVAFLMTHALRFYSDFYEPAEHSTEARNIAGYLLTRPDKLSVTPREIEKVRRGLQSDRRLTLAAMQDLETAGWVSVAASDRSKDGPTKWTVNPKIHTRFAERAVREKAHREAAREQVLAAMSARKELRDVQ